MINFETILSLEPSQIRYELINMSDEILPELLALKGVDKTYDTSHKDNYIHTLQVVENTYKASDKKALRLVSILHDIGKASTKKYTQEGGWSFHGHEQVGADMLPTIFERLNIDNTIYDYVYKLVSNHGLPKELINSTDSALRRFDKEVNADLEDLILFCKCDITTTNQDKKARQLKCYDDLYNRILEIRKNDLEREWKCVITGEMIMEHFKLDPGGEVGKIKSIIIKAMKSNLLENDLEKALDFMKNIKL